VDQLNLAANATDTSRLVADTFVDVAEEQGVRLGTLEAGTRLLDLGLDSLCLAVIVVRLEIRLGKDPFSEGADVALPATFGEFVGLYVNG
jgi:acyl carrier protein